MIATPVDLRRIITIRQPACRVTYELKELGHPTLREVLGPLLEKATRHG
jgi:predicted GTPase